jgi:membrane protein YqaA with SNARE-associated domain
MTENVNPMENWLLGTLGGAVGGALGYFAFDLLAGQGFYALVLPGALLGLGCGFLSGIRSNGLGVVCAIAALLLGIFIEWQFFPFIDDGGLTYFLKHLHELKSMTIIMIVLGGLAGYWFGVGRAEGAESRRSESNAVE